MEKKIKAMRHFTFPTSRLFRILVVLHLLFFLAGSALYAEKIPPDQVKVSTPVYKPILSNFEPRLGIYSYVVSWNGIPAGSIDLEINRTSSEFQIRAKARTAKGIDLIYKLRYQTEAIVSADTLMPRKSVYVSKENSKKKKTELTFYPDGTIHSLRTDRKGKVKTLQFKSDNFTLDPYSAAFLALSLDWEVGDTRRFDTFNGKSRYLIELTAVDRTTIEANGKTREAIVIQPRVTTLTDTEPSSKLLGARIYISTDRSREILRIVSDLFIGSVQTKLVDFKPIPPPPPSLDTGGKSNEIK